MHIRVILGLYGDNGKENGNYYNGSYRVYVCAYTTRRTPERDSFQGSKASVSMGSDVWVQVVAVFPCLLKSFCGSADDVGYKPLMAKQFLNLLLPTMH